MSATRVASLASGRGGLPTAEEWPFVVAIILLLAVVGSRLLNSFGLTPLESVLVAGVSPVLVLVDAPLGHASSNIALAANLTGCVIPVAVGFKVLVEGRIPMAETALLLGFGIITAYFSSHVVADRGVMLQYRVPSVIVGVMAAGFLFRQPEQAGAAAFAAGAIGVLVGADVMHLPELVASGGAGRVILGGAGLLDGIILVAILSAAIGECIAVLLRSITGVRTPTEPVV